MPVLLELAYLNQLLKVALLLESFSRPFGIAGLLTNFFYRPVPWAEMVKSRKGLPYERGCGNLKFVTRLLTLELHARRIESYPPCDSESDVFACLVALVRIAQNPVLEPKHLFLKIFVKLLSSSAEKSF